MSEAKYTPGPWAFETDCNCDWVYTTQTPEDGGDIICMPPDMDDSFKRWPANRALIAASPDLLEALQILLFDFESVVKDAAGQPSVIIAKEAISKALNQS